jgi:diaminopimelate decarboxylase
MELSWQIINQLEKEFGESFYILDIEKFQQNYQEFLEAFRSIYPNSNLGYSYKTNYTPKLCQYVNSVGGYAEVVSRLEYDLAIRIGVSPSRIIFNGPLKFREDIENAITAGSIVNLDSLREVSIVKELAQSLPEDRQFAVGLRCNFEISSGRISRFGFDTEGGELEYAFNTLEQLKNCSVEGLHCHFSTSERSVESYALRAKKMLALCDLLFQERQPKFINLGGGFFGKMSEDLRKQFDCHIPSYQEYAEAIASQFVDRFSQNSRTKLILEPGVAVVADIMKFVSKVVGVKTVRSRKLALVTGSIQNVKPTLNSKNLLTKVYRKDKSFSQERLAAPVDLVGYTCMEHDCLYQEYRGEIAVDDYVVFDNVGAYTIVFKPPFIRSSPPIISYNSSLNKYELIKRRETFQELFATYVI